MLGKKNITKLLIYYHISIFGLIPSLKKLQCLKIMCRTKGVKETFNSMLSKKVKDINLGSFFNDDLYIELNDRLHHKLNLFRSIKDFSKIRKSSKLFEICNEWKNYVELSHNNIDNNECRNLIKNEFSEDVLLAYDKLNPGAFKSDLWRLCALYIYGGLYTDMHVRPSVNSPFLSVMYACDYFFCIDFPSSNKYIYNAIIKAPKKSPLLMRIINNILENVRDEIYPDRDLEITGPGLHGKIIMEHLNLSTLEETIIEMNDDIYILSSHVKINEKDYGVYLQGTKLFDCRFNGYRKEITEICELDHYSNFFENRNVYDDNIIMNKIDTIENEFIKEFVCDIFTKIIKNSSSHYI